MIGVPYLVLAGLIGLIYRSCKAASQRGEQAVTAWTAARMEVPSALP